MPLNKSDKDWIKSAVKEAVAEVIIPVREDVQKHDQTLCGETKNNGMRKDVSDIKTEMQSMKVKMGWIAGLISGGFLVAKEVAFRVLGLKS